MSGGGDEIPLFASVAVPVPVRRLFSYKAPSRLQGAIEVGSRVRVPFGRRTLVGTVVEWPVAPPGEAVEVREVEAVLSEAPHLDPPVLALTRFVAEYYLTSWGEAIEAALPPAPHPRSRPRFVRRLPGADPSVIPVRAIAQRRLLASLPSDGTAVALGRLGKAGVRASLALASLGLVEVAERTDCEEKPASAGRGTLLPPPVLTSGQAAVLEKILPAVSRRTYAPFLLFGATGSGKTEVYLRAAMETLDAGRGVLYLVPEIGLTPLLVAKLDQRIPGGVAVLHSGLTARERYDAWDRVRRGACRFLVGARSAVFALMPDPGLVVVDEEQDGSYKQEESPRYNGRDLAILRAREAGSVLLLGSATPSMETFRHAKTGRYALLRLGGRVEDRPLPGVEIVDMRKEFQDRGEAHPLSRRLVRALRECLDRGEQALVLRNRRGWAVSVFCPSCGTTVTCSRCSISLTWHRAARRLRCHYCAFETAFPPRCPTCAAEELRLLGEGAERVEQELRDALPGARLERMDRDTVRRKGSQAALLTRFDRGEIDVLVGTQMIAKGHDFPRVTLVGVLSADQALGLPDFRAGERTFQLLTQVAGRAGRSEHQGQVVIQAFDPSHPILLHAAAQDYEAFYEREIRYRLALRYPPVTALVQILVTDRQALRAASWAAVLAEALEREGRGRLFLAGPGPAPIERLKGLFRQQILVRSSGRRRLVETVGRALAAVEGKIPGRAIVVDVDPVSVL